MGRVQPAGRAGVRPVSKGGVRVRLVGRAEVWLVGRSGVRVQPVGRLDHCRPAQQPNYRRGS